MTSEKTTNDSSAPIRVWNLVGILGISGTIVSVLSGWFWIADLCSQLNVQYLGLVILALPLWIHRRMKKTLLLAAGGIAFNLYMIAPYFLQQSTDESNRPDFQLAIFNVLRTNENVEQTRTEVMASDPDFLFLMETGPNWDETLKALSDTYPHQKRLCREDYTGVAFLSKHPWQSLVVVDVPDANPPLDVSFDINGSAFRMILTHPLPPISPSLRKARDNQLLHLAGEISSEFPTLFAGDFNLAPWSYHFGQLLKAGELRDLSLGFGVAPTLTPLPTWFGGVKVDHILGNKSVSVEDFQLGSSEFSDHRPVIIEFSIE